MTIFTFGNAGGVGGAAFTDPTGQITRIDISYGAYINQFNTVRYDGSASSHGTVAGAQVASFFLNFNEVLVAIEGKLSTNEDGGPYVASIKFTAKDGAGNSRSSGEFGTTAFQATYKFEAPYYRIPGGPYPVTYSLGQIIGFTGRSGSYLDAIGIQIQVPDAPNA